MVFKFSTASCSAPAHTPCTAGTDTTSASPRSTGRGSRRRYSYVPQLLLGIGNVGQASRQPSTITMLQRQPEPCRDTRALLQDPGVLIGQRLPVQHLLDHRHRRDERSEEHTSEL